MPDMLSDMKTFTVRDLDRKPGEVLDFCDREGLVRILRRDGRSYMMRAESAPLSGVDWHRFLKEHRARVKSIFPKRIPSAQARAADKLIRGE